MVFRQLALFPPALLLAITASVAASPVPVGDEFQVNEATTMNQVRPNVAAASDGRFVVVWQDFLGGYGSSFRLFTSNGSPVGSPGEVPTIGTSQRHPRAAVDSNGGFVVVWDEQSTASDPGYSVRAARLGSTGAIVGTDFQVNTGTTSFQRYPDVAFQSNDDFVVVWHSSVSSGTDTDGRSIQMQRYASDGTPLGVETQVNEWTTGDQTVPVIAVGNDDVFVVAWSSPAAVGSAEILARRFGSEGSPLGTELVVNELTSGFHGSPAISHAADRFVVAWAADEIGGRILDAAGVPVGAEIQFNASTSGFQGAPDVSARSDGGFQAAWYSFGSVGSDNDSASIQTRRFDSSGSPSAPEIQVNVSTAGFQAFPSIAGVGPDQLAVVWESDSSSGDDSSGRSIQLQRMGDDFDGDGSADVVDPDDDNDGVADGIDDDPLDPDVCRDLDSDTCDDCSVGTDDLGPEADFDVLNDGSDIDGDGTCDLGDPDDDGDGCLDGEDLFPEVFSADSDEDGNADDCDLCPGFDDGVDTDGDGSPDGCDLCTGDDATGDTDTDGVCDGIFLDGFETGNVSSWT